MKHALSSFVGMSVVLVASLGLTPKASAGSYVMVEANSDVFSNIGWVIGGTLTDVEPNWVRSSLIYNPESFTGTLNTTSEAKAAPHTTVAATSSATAYQAGNLTISSGATATDYIEFAATAAGTMQYEIRLTVSPLQIQGPTLCTGSATAEFVHQLLWYDGGGFNTPETIINWYGSVTQSLNSSGLTTTTIAPIGGSLGFDSGVLSGSYLANVALEHDTGYYSMLTRLHTGTSAGHFDDSGTASTISTANGFSTMGYGSDGHSSFWDTVTGTAAFHDTTSSELNHIPEPSTGLLVLVLAGAVSLNRRQRKVAITD